MNTTVLFSVKNSLAGSEVVLTINGIAKQYISSHASFSAAKNFCDELNDVILQLPAHHLQKFAQELHDKNNLTGMSYYEHAQLRAIKAVHLYVHGTIIKIKYSQLPHTA